MDNLICRAPGRSNPVDHTCGTKLGEAPDPLRFVGVVLRWNDRIPATAGPRDVRRCPKCGWFNLFTPTAGNGNGRSCG